MNLLHTEEKVKTEQVPEVPNHDGERFIRPGKQAALTIFGVSMTMVAAANNGAVAPDMSVINLARHGRGRA